MPQLDLDMFKNPPEIGDKITVKGKVESIDEDTGSVDVSYDTVTNETKKSTKRSSKDDNDNEGPTIDDALGAYMQNQSENPSGIQ